MWEALLCQLFGVLYPIKCFRILPLYICPAVLYEIVCLQFSICSLLSVLFNVFVSLPQSDLYDVLILKTLGVHVPETPSPYSSHQRRLKPDLTREGNKRVRCIRHLRKALANLCFRKQGATLANFILCYQKIFVPRNSVIKIHAYF